MRVKRASEAYAAFFTNFISLNPCRVEGPVFEPAAYEEISLQSAEQALEVWRPSSIKGRTLNPARVEGYKGVGVRPHR